MMYTTISQRACTRCFRVKPTAWYHASGSTFPPPTFECGCSSACFPSVGFCPIPPCRFKHEDRFLHQTSCTPQQGTAVPGASVTQSPSTAISRRDPHIAALVLQTQDVCEGFACSILMSHNTESCANQLSSHPSGSCLAQPLHQTRYAKLSSLICALTVPTLASARSHVVHHA